MSFFTVVNTLYLISNAFRTYVVYRFTNVFFKEKRCAWYTELIVYTLMFLLNSAAYFRYANPLLNMLSMVVPLIAITFLYSKKVIFNVGISLAIFMMMLICDALMAPLISYSPIVESGTATALMSFFVCLLLEWVFHKRDFQGVRGQELLAIFSVPVGSIILFTLTAKTYQPIVLIEAIVLMAINIIVFYLFGSLDQAHHELREQMLTAQQAKAYMNQLDIVYQSQEQQRYLRHDMKNHLQRMSVLLDQNALPELRDYIRKSTDSLTNPREYVHSGNRDIDSLLNYKLGQAKEEGAEIHAEVIIPDGLKVDSFDIVSLLGNLLDNALEALDKAEEKKLNISIRYEKQMLLLSVRNTCAAAPAFEGQKPVRRPEDDPTYDPSRRGIGLKSVAHTLRKYDGNIKYSYEEPFFNATAIMYL
ncbi:MAG: GHKL domain-containing protein [Oscillospiraceae bacterium]|nr:GHKL domain-containing protein [Oscillospiraceae bacterium]MCR5305258.1 GHKL domain-containing protein [Oscillospiraceae bacterium]